MLAICRGMQVVNVTLGGGIHNHLPDVFGQDVAHVGDEWAVLPHDICLDPESRLHDWLGTQRFSSLSGHHQAILTLGRGLRANAWAPDGVIEAFEHETHPFLVGVQWHPELNADKDPVQQRLFDCLVAAAKRHGRKTPPDYPSVASSLGEWFNWAVCEGERKIGIRPIEATNGHLTRIHVTQDVTDG